MYIENPHLHDPIPKMEKHTKHFSRIDRTNETRATRQIWSSPWSHTTDTVPQHFNQKGHKLTDEHIPLELIIINILYR